jgi:hypothetical protein
VCGRVDAGLVQGKHLSVDGSFVEANAAKESRIPREPLAEAAQVHHTVRQYLREVEEQNPVEEPEHEQDQVSTTDPDSTYATKGGTPARLGYYDNYLVDNESCVIVGVQATAARMSQETVAAQDVLTCFTEWQGRAPESVGADTTYGNGEFLQWLADRNVTPYMRTRDSIHRKKSPFFGPERFTYEPEHDRYTCPAGQPLNYGSSAATRKSTASLVRVLTSSNFIVFPFLPFPACFFLHWSGSGKKQGGTVKGTERRPKEGGRSPISNLISLRACNWPVLPCCISLR